MATGFLGYTPRAASSRTSSIPGGASSTKVHLKWCGAAPLRLHGSFELEKALRARHVRAGRAELPLCDSPSHRQHKETSKPRLHRPERHHPPPPTGSADRAAHVARTCRPIADAIEPSCKPGSLKTWSLLFCTRACPGTWRRRRVRACTDPHTGSASCQICMDPLPMRRSQ